MTSHERVAELLTRSTPGFEAERLILEATELILELMEDENVTRTELAERLGKSKGHVSQLLNGDRNMTLRTLAEISYALGHRIRVNAEPLRARRGQNPDEESNTLRTALDWLAEDIGTRHHDLTPRAVQAIRSRVAKGNVADWATARQPLSLPTHRMTMPGFGNDPSAKRETEPEAYVGA